MDMDSLRSDLCQLGKMNNNKRRERERELKNWLLQKLLTLLSFLEHCACMANSTHIFIGGGNQFETFLINTENGEATR